MTVPLLPPANTTDGDTAETVLRLASVPVLTPVHCEPSKCAEAPPLPTAHTSVAEVPSIASQPLVPSMCSNHEDPLRRSRRPWAPPRNTSLSENTFSPNRESRSGTSTARHVVPSKCASSDEA